MTTAPLTTDDALARLMDVIARARADAKRKEAGHAATRQLPR